MAADAERAGADVTADRPLTDSAPGADGYRRDHPAAVRATVLDADKALLDLRGRRSFALCGFAESSRAKVPVDDPLWVLVGLNQLYRHLPRWDVWFDIHSYWREGNLEGTDHEGWLRRCGIPVVMARREPEIPTSVRFPIERAIEAGGDYFTSTASFMVAWAVDHIDREVRARASGVFAAERSLWDAASDLRKLYGEYSIAVVGIDLVADEEFAHQRPCMEYWLGRAAARGIRLLIPHESALLKQAFRYGYEREPDTGLLRPSDFAARGAELDAQVHEAMAQVERLAGRREEQMYWKQVMDLRRRGAAVAPGKGF